MTNDEMEKFINEVRQEYENSKKQIIIFIRNWLFYTIVGKTSLFLVFSNILSVKLITSITIILITIFILKNNAKDKTRAENTFYIIIFFLMSFVLIANLSLSFFGNKYSLADNTEIVKGFLTSSLLVLPFIIAAIFHITYTISQCSYWKNLYISLNRANLSLKYINSIMDKALEEKSVIISHIVSFYNNSLTLKDTDKIKTQKLFNDFKISFKK